MGYILLREAYIANTRNDTSGTSSDSDKLCNSFIQVHIQGKSDVEDLPLPHTHTHMHTSIYHIAGKFDGELNLAVWRSGLKPPN